MPRFGKLVGKSMDRKRLARSAFGPQFTPSGNIDIEKTLWALRHSHRPDLDLAETLRAVWADAYAHGWSDGENDADPNVRSNPYGT